MNETERQAEGGRMSDDTEWTDEKRKEREAERAGARHMLQYVRHGAIPKMEDGWAEATVDSLLPPPPPLHTYGREMVDPVNGFVYRRRSDGEWQILSVSGDWEASTRTDAHVRAFAAEVPLTDAECDAILNVASCTWSAESRERLRAAFARVLRGEVRGE